MHCNLASSGYVPSASQRLAGRYQLSTLSHTSHFRRAATLPRRMRLDAGELPPAAMKPTWHTALHPARKAILTKSAVPLLPSLISTARYRWTPLPSPIQGCPTPGASTKARSTEPCCRYTERDAATQSPDRQIPEGSGGIGWCRNLNLKSPNLDPRELTHSWEIFCSFT